jgi:hypothetical protein
MDEEMESLMANNTLAPGGGLDLDPLRELACSISLCQHFSSSDGGFVAAI